MQKKQILNFFEFLTIKIALSRAIFIVLEKPSFKPPTQTLAYLLFVKVLDVQINSYHSYTKIKNMKKNQLALGAIICAFAFSAFTKPFASVVFKLKRDPISQGIVDNSVNYDDWATNGALYGSCTVLGVQDLACTITLQSGSMSAYYHASGASNVINSIAYAIPSNAPYLEIVEQQTYGQGGVDRKIVSITPKTWDAISGRYIIDNSVSYGQDYTFVNAKETNP
jgi:hypothetical protein